MCLEKIFSLSQVSTEFKALCTQYQYLAEGVATERVKGMLLSRENYQSKYHLLVYLDEMENSRRMIQE